MIKQGIVNFVAQKTQPNPKEVSYWIDLNENNIGKSIKVYDGMKWVYLFDTPELPNIDIESKADRSNTYTKPEVNIMIQNLQKQINQISNILKELA